MFQNKKLGALYTYYDEYSTGFVAGFNLNFADRMRYFNWYLHFAFCEHYFAYDIVSMSV